MGEEQRLRVQLAEVLEENRQLRVELSGLRSHRDGGGSGTGRRSSGEHEVGREPSFVGGEKAWVQGVKEEEVEAEVEAEEHEGWDYDDPTPVQGLGIPRGQLFHVLNRLNGVVLRPPLLCHLAKPA